MRAKYNFQLTMAKMSFSSTCPECDGSGAEGKQCCGNYDNDGSGNPECCGDGDPMECSRCWGKCVI